MLLTCNGQLAASPEPIDQDDIKQTPKKKKLTENEKRNIKKEKEKEKEVMCDVYVANKITKGQQAYLHTLLK